MGYIPDGRFIFNATSKQWEYYTYEYIYNKKEKEISKLAEPAEDHEQTDEEKLAWFESIEDETPEEWRQ